MTGLLPCPFCGVSHSYMFGTKDGVRKVQIRFGGEGCPLEMMWFTEEEWNARAYPRLKKAIEEIAKAEEKYKAVFHGKVPSPNSRQPKSYWEGLVSGLISAQITLWHNIPEAKEAKDE